ncbi:hypothetical protein [Polaromonas sp. SM01]|nr:hypothetical protein [Polaromonas sp. SM01]
MNDAGINKKEEPFKRHMNGHQARACDDRRGLISATKAATEDPGEY